MLQEACCPDKNYRFDAWCGCLVSGLSIIACTATLLVHAFASLAVMSG